MHLVASLAAHGWHPAAWRVTGKAGFDGVAPFRTMARDRRARRNWTRSFWAFRRCRWRSARAASTASTSIRCRCWARMIAATQHIGLCAWWPADIAEPYHVARVFATLDHLAGGRTGWIAGLAGSERTCRSLPAARSADIRPGRRGAAGRADRRGAPALGQLGRPRLRGRPVDRHFRRSGEGASDRSCRPFFHGARAAERAAARAGPARHPLSRPAVGVRWCRGVEIVLAECATMAEAKTRRAEWRYGRLRWRLMARRDADSGGERGGGARSARQTSMSSCRSPENPRRASSARRSSSPPGWRSGTPPGPATGSTSCRRCPRSISISSSMRSCRCCARTVCGLRVTAVRRCATCSACSASASRFAA